MTRSVHGILSYELTYCTCSRICDHSQVVLRCGASAISKLRPKADKKHKVRLWNSSQHLGKQACGSNSTDAAGQPCVYACKTSRIRNTCGAPLASNEEKDRFRSRLYIASRLLYTRSAEHYLPCPSRLRPGRHVSFCRGICVH